MAVLAGLFRHVRATSQTFAFIFYGDFETSSGDVQPFAISLW